MRRKKSRLVCDICGKTGAKIRKIVEVFGKKKDLLLIEDIPVIACPNCCESYFTAETLHKIEIIRAKKERLAVSRAVKVAHFAA